MSSKSPSFPRKQSGMALMTAILLLVVMTIMATSMMSSYGVEEKIAGNTREKERALNAAVSAQQYAEYWLSTNSPVAATCTGPVSSNIGQVCNAALTTPEQLPWASYVTYTQFTSNPIDPANPITITGSGPATQGTYFAAPVFYIQDLGANPGTPAGELYQIDATGYGGTANAVAVVESTYVITSNTAHSLDP
jgi:type IV pilus assembly protein PilX